MFFTSPEFIAFFVVTWLFWRYLVKWRRQTLVLCSIFFLALFSWSAAALAVLVALLNFAAAQLSERKIFYLAIQLLNILAIPLAALVSGSAFFFETDNGTGAWWIVTGLSFYNLSHIAYQADVRAKRISAETDPVSYLFVALFFPKVLSGPITLFQQLRPQLNGISNAVPDFPGGVNRVALGYFKKLVIADALAPTVSSVFDHNDSLPGITILAGAMIFTVQLYFDFSGYCDIAIGCGRLLGISLPENFYLPLRSRSIKDFWRRWHITLLGFLNSYLFQPIVYRLRKLKRHGPAAGIVIVFLVSALWHGFGLTFLAWGMFHALLMLTGYYSRGTMIRLPAVFSVSGVFILFSLGNIFFRSPEWVMCVGKISTFFREPFLPEEWDAGFFAPLAVGGHQADLFNFLMTIFMALSFLLFERLILSLVEEKRLRMSFLYATVILIFLFGVFGNAQRFIYMQF